MRLVPTVIVCVIAAIAESLKTSSSSTAMPTSSVYPSEQRKSGSSKQKKSGRVVKALYDFEAAEDNELTFKGTS